MTQAIFAQAGDAIYRAGAVVVDAVVTGAQWLGRTVVYLKDVFIDYAAKAIDLGGYYFGALKDVIAQNPQAFTVAGVVVGVGVTGLVLARLLGKPVTTPTPVTV